MKILKLLHKPHLNTSNSTDFVEKDREIDLHISNISMYIIHIIKPMFS